MNTTKFTPKEAGAMWIFSGTLCLILVLTGATALIKQYNRKNIAGRWNMIFIHEQGHYTTNIKAHTQRILFTQNDETVTGTGENPADHEKAFPHKMKYKGVVESDVLKATYTLWAQEKETTGIIEVTITGDGKNLTGTFAGTANDAKGIVTGEKLD